jgi:hypothetical protein
MHHCYGAVKHWTWKHCLDLDSCRGPVYLFMNTERQVTSYDIMVDELSVEQVIFRDGSVFASYWLLFSTHV